MHTQAFISISIVLLLESLLPAISLPSSAEEYSATVLKVSDGDTLTVLHEQRRVKVRLAGIDCPEKEQPWGARARAMTASLSKGETVRINCRGRDRYGRTIAVVDLPDGRKLNEELVRSGMAWWYRKYSNDRRLYQAEVQARESRSGLWSDSSSVAPWDFRRHHRSRRGRR